MTTPVKQFFYLKAGTIKIYLQKNTQHQTYQKKTAPTLRYNRAAILLIFLLASCASVFAEEMAEQQDTKLIQLGWDMVDTAFVREHLVEMETSCPFNGIVLMAFGKRIDGSLASPLRAWDDAVWDHDSFQPAINDLKACNFVQFTDNFACLNCTPGTLAWDDDTGWKTLSDKASIMAWVCKEGGLKGIFLDIESYGENQFQYKAAKNRSFSETAALARLRGEQVMNAFAAEYPSMTLLSTFLASLCMEAGQTAYPEDVLATHQYGLWPSFINGLLDALPPEMTLVDGNQGGYYLEPPQYYSQARLMRSLTGPALALIAPENKKKYHAQMQIAFGIYLDMFINPEGSSDYRGPNQGGTRLDHLRDNMSAAVEASDQYIWVYGEQCKWWPSYMFTDWYLEKVMEAVGQGRLWEETLPGIARALAFVRDPLGTTLAEVEAKRTVGELVNLAKNGDFSERNDYYNLPTGFSAWSDEEALSQGSFEWSSLGDGSALMRDVTLGCFFQDHVVEPGELYFVEAMAKTEGISFPTVLVRWKHPDGEWMSHDLGHDVTLTFGTTDVQGWRRAQGPVTVPEDAGHLTILLCCGTVGSHQGNLCYFDNLGLYHLDSLSD